MTVHLSENNVVHSALLQLAATDLDTDHNARLHYVIGDVIAHCADAATGCDVITESSRAFDVDRRSGLLSATSSVDRENYSQFIVTVLAVDHGTPAQTGTATVTVIVDDVNDQRPTFIAPRNATGNSNGGLEMRVWESAAEGDVVGQLRAVDDDATPTNSRIRYSLRVSPTQTQPQWQESSAKFDVDAETGKVRLRATLDREHQATYVMLAVACDSASRALSSVEQLTVTVLDVNDNDPVFVFPTPHNDTVTISTSLPLGHPITRVLAHDADQGHNARLTYRLPSTGDNTDRRFQIHRQHGVVYLNFRFDHVTYADYRITVVAEDHGIVSRSATAQLVVVVNRSIPFPLPAGSRDPEMVRYNVAIVVVGVLTLAALVGVVVLVLVAVARRRDDDEDPHLGSPLSSVSTNYFHTQQLADITPRSSTVCCLHVCLDTNY